MKVPSSGVTLSDEEAVVFYSHEKYSEYLGTVDGNQADKMFTQGKIDSLLPAKGYDSWNIYRLHPLFETYRLELRMATKEARKDAFNFKVVPQALAA